jgi:hypothetical protein
VFAVDLPRWSDWAALAVSVLCAGTFLLISYRVRGARLTAAKACSVRAPAPPDQPEPREAASLLSRQVDRRRWRRRHGELVEVRVSDAEARADPAVGWVLDRCDGGLRLLVAQAVPEGTTLSVRATAAAKAAGWVQVAVRHRLQKGKCWEIGCQFVELPSPDILSLFG